MQRVMHKESVGEDARSCARNVRNSNRCKRGTDPAIALTIGEVEWRGYTLAIERGAYDE